MKRLRGEKAKRLRGEEVKRLRGEKAQRHKVKKQATEFHRRHGSFKIKIPPDLHLKKGGMIPRCSVCSVAEI